MLPTELAALFSRDIGRLIDEIRAFPDSESMWTTVPGVTNPAGNLAQHLEGNLREYIGRQLGQIDCKRDRPLEFSARDVAQTELIARLEALKDSIPRVIASLSGDQLDAIYPDNVLKKPISTRQFLIHLAGHLNYHLGQIDYLRRVVTGDSAIELTGL